MILFIRGGEIMAEKLSTFASPLYFSIILFSEVLVFNDEYNFVLKNVELYRST